MAEDARFVTIRKVADPLEAEMLKDLLEQEGIPATIQGTNHSAFYGGALASAPEVPLLVPEEHAERALAIIGALSDFEPIEPQMEERAPVAPGDERGAGPYRSGGLTEPKLPPRKMLVAIAAALIIPLVIMGFGAGHFYARSYPRGFVLLFLGWTSVVMLFSGGYAWPVYAIPILILLDATGAVMVVREGQKPVTR